MGACSNKTSVVPDDSLGASLSWDIREPVALDCEGPGRLVLVVYCISDIVCFSQNVNCASVARSKEKWLIE